jgi:hypothetical protein
MHLQREDLGIRLAACDSAQSAYADLLRSLATHAKVPYSEIESAGGLLVEDVPVALAFGGLLEPDILKSTIQLPLPDAGPSLEYYRSLLLANAVLPTGSLVFSAHPTEPNGLVTARFRFAPDSAIDERAAEILNEIAAFVRAYAQHTNPSTSS